MRAPSQDNFFLDRLRKGNAAYREGRYRDAVREYQEAVSLAPSAVSAHSNLGRALVKLGRHEEAVSELESALKLSPEHGPSLYYLALCMDHKGLWDRAVMTYERFLRSALGATPGYAEKARGRIRELKDARPTPGSVRPEGNAPDPVSETVPKTAKVWGVGQVVDDIYKVEELLGEGGFGSVHRVEHLGWQMRLAVKSPREDRVFDASAKERFVQEANTWVGLGSHPNIVTCYFVRLIEGLPRIFIECLEAGSMREWLAKHKNVDGKTTLDAAIQLARAMERVQYHGLVHRDLKPENCLMTPEGVLKVTDFGLAKGGEEEDAPEGRPEPARGGKTSGNAGTSGLYRLGTPEYMAPEQWYQAGKATSAADVWAFGIMLFEMLHGKRPFRHLKNELPLAFFHRMKESRWKFGFRKDAPAELRSIVSSCLAEDAGKREPKFSVIRERLEALYAVWFEEPYRRLLIKPTPPLADTLNNQGVSMADLGRIEDALKRFQAALNQDPTHPGAMYNQGILLMKKGRLSPDELATRLEGCKRARPREWAPEYLRRLVCLRDKDNKTAIREFKEAQRIWDNPLVRRVLAFAEAGRHGDALELFVSPPTSTEAAIAEEVTFYNLLALAKVEADAGRAYETLMAARGVKGYERTPLALSLQANLGRGGVRKDLRAGWLKRTWGSSENCLCAAISTDGQQAITGHKDGMVKLWELETGIRLRVMGCHRAPVKTVCVLPDMSAALSGDSNGAMKIWDLISGVCVRTLEEHTGAVNVLCGFPDGKHALSAGDDGTIGIWNLEDGTIRHSIPAHQGAVRSVRLTRDGTRAVSLGAEGLLKQWNPLKGRDLCEPIDVGAANALSLRADGRFAFIAGGGGVAEWDLETRSRMRRARLKGQESPFRAVDLTSDGKFLITGGDDRVVRLWAMSGQGQSLKAVWAFEAHKKAITFVTFSPEARWALSVGRDGLRLWDLDWEFVFPGSL